MNKINFESLNSDSLKFLKHLANEHKKNCGERIQITFNNSNPEDFEKNQIQIFHLKRLNKSGYIETEIEPIKKGERWKIKVSAEGYTYLQYIKNT